MPERYRKLPNMEPYELQGLLDKVQPFMAIPGTQLVDPLSRLVNKFSTGGFSNAQRKPFPYELSPSLVNEDLTRYQDLVKREGLHGLVDELDLVDGSRVGLREDGTYVDPREDELDRQDYTWDLQYQTALPALQVNMLDDIFGKDKTKKSSSSYSDEEYVQSLQNRVRSGELSEDDFYTYLEAAGIQPPTPRPERKVQYHEGPQGTPQDQYHLKKGNVTSPRPEIDNGIRYSQDMEDLMANLFMKAEDEGNTLNKYTSTEFNQFPLDYQNYITNQGTGNFATFPILAEDSMVPVYNEMEKQGKVSVNGDGDFRLDPYYRVESETRQMLDRAGGKPSVHPVAMGPSGAGFKSQLGKTHLTGVNEEYAHTAELIKKLNKLAPELFRK